MPVQIGRTPALPDTPPAPDTASWRVGTLILLTCATVLGLTGWHAWTGHQSQLREAMTDTANLAASFAQHAQDAVELADAVLSDVVRRVEEDGAGEAQPAALGRAMAERSAASSRVHNIALTNAEGAWIASSLPSFPRGASSADQDFFAWHRDHPDREPRVGAALRGQAMGKWAVPVTRRINRPDGSFGGVAMAEIDAEVFQSLYRRVDLGRQGAAALLHQDGTILVRVPYSDAAAGADVRGEAYWRDHVAPLQADSFEYMPTAAGPVRLGSIQRTARYGLVAFVGLSKAEVLAEWRAEVILEGAIVLLLVLVGAVLGWQQAGQASRRRRLERDAARALSGYRLLADNATDLILRLDGALRRTYVSPASRRVMGLPPEALLGGTPQGVVHPEDASAVEAAFAQARGSTAGAAVCYRGRHGSGCWIWLEASIRRVPGDGSDPGLGGDPRAGEAACGTDGYVVVVRDVSRRKLAELELAEANARLETLARKDGLTGLANRHCLDEALDREHRRAARSGTSVALLMLDVDRFKAFNDLYGHQGGDEALRRIAAAVSATMHRPGDLAARCGGEELAVLLPETDLRGAAELAERVREAVRTLRIPHAGSNCGIATVSIGVAALHPQPGSLDGRTGMAALVAAADQALYEAKRGGRDQVRMAGTGSAHAALDAAAA